MFSWFRDLQRNALLKDSFPEAWNTYLTQNVAHYNVLSEEEQAKLRDDLRILIAEKYWEGCDGLEVTDEMKVTIAAQASLLILNLEHEFYPNVMSILVYPADYHHPERQTDASGVVTESVIPVLGQAWSESLPIILSWADARDGGANPTDGHNVVYHEFAHKLDFRDGAGDGVPRLETDAQYDEWAEVMSSEFEQLRHHSEQGHAKLLDSYGATNAAEFFAVATECFFEKSVRMRDTHPRLYHVLSGFYRQDPAARIEANKEAQDREANELR